MADISRFLTAGEILNDTAVQVGLLPVANPVTSTDSSFVQLKYLLTSAGRELLTAHDWTQLTKEATLTVPLGGTDRFSLPSDYDRLLDQSMWDRLNSNPLDPVSSQDWQYFKAQLPNDSTSLLSFRINNDQIQVYPPPPTGSGTWASVYYDYISRGWVRAAGSTTRFMDFVEATGDTVLYDPTLTIKLLKVRFLSAKGFSTTAAVRELDLALDAAKSRSTPAATLSLVPCCEVAECDG